MCWGHYQRNRRHGDPHAGGISPGTTASAVDAIARYLPDPGPCLLWQYSVHPDGYGMAKYAGRRMTASRAVLIAVTGDDPADMEAAHICGNPPCVNPAHLRWATKTENAGDRLSHGTHSRGERSANAKLTADQVQDIRTRIANGDTNVAIAADYSITDSLVSRIKHRRAWAWLSD